MGQGTTRLALGAAFFLFFLFNSSLKAEPQAFRDSYYMMIFSYQDYEGHPKSTHTFASFYREGERAYAANRNYQIPTISWLPDNTVIRPLRVQRGKNFSLRDTVRLANSIGASIKYWGTFQITPQLYARALKRIAFLESGHAFYKAIGEKAGPNPYDQPGRSMNCIHAVSDIGGPLELGWRFGYEATANVVGFLSRHIYNYPQTREDLTRAFHIPEILARRF